MKLSGVSLLEQAGKLKVKSRTYSLVLVLKSKALYT